MEDRALYYILHNLGDAVSVDEPVWTGDTWKLPLRVRGFEGNLGQIMMTAAGDIIKGSTTSRMVLKAAIRAALSLAV